MKKYGHVFSVGVQNNLTYRFNYLTRTLFSFVPLFAMLSLWRTVYASKGGGQSLSGWTEAQTVFYYILVAIVDVTTAVNDDDWQIAADIREGNISQFLIKPVNYLWYRLCLFFAGRAAYVAIAAAPLAAFVFCFRKDFAAPATLAAWAAFPISLLLTALLQFFISYTMAMLAFWLLEISTLIFILFAFEYVASGHIFPLAFLIAKYPAAGHALFFTPFPSMLYVPVAIYMGKIPEGEIWPSLMMQLAWVLAAFLLARFAWSRGIRKYSAFGG
ncbi:MAG: ABC-2 family transporter protein [Verrucomicrobiota bacterium]|nr:ABC-2 family transporter protein [Verrucomicrobiota bacterium]